MESNITSTNLINHPPLITYKHQSPQLSLQSEQKVPPLHLNRHQGFTLQSSFTPRPPFSNGPANPLNSQVTQSQILQGTPKYRNKYSFKRNSTARAKASSFRNPVDTINTINAVVFQESILGSVRSLAVTRRGQIKEASRTREGVTLWNTLTEIYNLTLAGQSSQLQPLQCINLNQQNHSQYPHEQLSHQIQFSKAVRPVQFLQNSQGQDKERVKSAHAVSPSIQYSNKDQPLPMDLRNLPINNSYELYTQQIRELRGKIEALEHEKSHLIERIQNTQSSGQDMQHYRSEINALRNQMTQLETSHQGAEAVEVRKTVRHYEEQLVQAHAHIKYLEQSRNQQAQAMQAELRALQEIVSEHTSLVDNRRKGEQSLLQQLEYARAQQERTLQILNQVNQENSHLKEELTRYQVQLLQALRKADETRGHLAIAQEYILQLQHSHVPSDLQNHLHAARQENSRLVNDVSTLKDQLNTARAQAEILMARAATATAEYDDMECRYRQTVESLNIRYDQLLDQRNALTTKLAATSTDSSPAADEAKALRISLGQLSAQVEESQQHLRTAEDYIEQNMQRWGEAVVLKEQYAQQQAFITTIHADLQATKNKNLQLAQRIQDYEHAVAEAEHLKQENEKLTIIIRQKDNTSLKQIDEAQAALAHQAILHRQSEARVKELEQYLTRAENFILEQESKMGESIHNFEKENAELKGQLSTAEDYILSLQKASQEERRLLVQAVQGRRAEKKRADGLLYALKKAQDCIAGLQVRN